MKEYKLEAAEAILKNLCVKLINKKFEALWLEKFIENFNLKKKPVNNAHQPNSATVYTTDERGQKVPKQATAHLNDIKKDIEDVELQEASIISLISELKREKNI